jgi:hypothetical protein
LNPTNQSVVASWPVVTGSLIAPKIIDLYPAQDSLASTLRETSSNGGNPYNVLIDLARYQAPFPLFAVGLVAGGGRVSPGAYLISGRGFGRHLDARMNGTNEPIGFKARVRPYRDVS